MSDLLKNLRSEQEHYNNFDQERSDRVKKIANHIEDLEQKLAKAVEVIQFAKLCSDHLPSCTYRTNGKCCCMDKDKYYSDISLRNKCDEFLKEIEGVE